MENGTKRGCDRVATYGTRRNEKTTALRDKGRSFFVKNIGA